MPDPEGMNTELSAYDRARLREYRSRNLRRQALRRAGNFARRKAERTLEYLRYSYGWILQACGACNGSGRYDHNGSPPCGCCNGTGKERVEGPKAQAKRAELKAAGVL